MKLNPRPFQCPNCGRMIYLATNSFRYEHSYRGPWSVDQNGELRRPGAGDGAFAIHHCKETM